MKRILLALAILAVLFSGPREVRAVDVSIDFFYDNLGSDGSWVEVDDYGYCWQPNVASNADWRPYADGYWAYTDVGWTWISNENFGWATYHYGRWARVRDHGWLWVPGVEWGPAWVSWRTGGDYVGWAPLPPRRRSGGGEIIYEGRPINGRVDIEFDIGPAYYNFVDVRYIGAPVLREHLYAPTENVTYINQTVNVTNITYTNSTVYNYGPDYDRLSSYSARPIQRLTLQRQTEVDLRAAAQSGAVTRVQGDQLMVAAPATFKKPAKAVAPKELKKKITKPDVETGWAGISDPKAKAEMQEKFKKEDPKAVPPPKREKTVAAAPAASASPAVSAVPAEQTPKGRPGVVAPVAGVKAAEAAADKDKEEKAKQAKDAADKRNEKTKQDAAAVVAPAAASSPGVPEPDKGKGKGKDKGTDKVRPEPAAAASPAAAEPDKGKGKGKEKGKALPEPAATQPAAPKVTATPKPAPPPKPVPTTAPEVLKKDKPAAKTEKATKLPETPKPVEPPKNKEKGGGGKKGRPPEPAAAPQVPVKPKAEAAPKPSAPEPPVRGPVKKADRGVDPKPVVKAPNKPAEPTGKLKRTPVPQGAQPAAGGAAPSQGGKPAKVEKPAKGEKPAKDGKKEKDDKSSPAPKP